MMNPGTQNQTIVLESSKVDINSSMLNDSKLPPKQSKSSLGNLGGAYHILKGKKKSKTTRPKAMLLPVPDSKANLKNPETMSLHHKLLKQRKDSKSKERSESAPLHKRKSVTTVSKTLLSNEQNSSSRLNNTTLNESMNRRHLGSSGKSKERKIKVPSKKGQFKKHNQMGTDVFEMELL
jgi:hypothetical protein